MNPSDTSVSKVYSNVKNDNPENYSPLRNKQKAKSPVRVEIINQNLEEAISDVKTSLKNSSFRKDVTELSLKYKGATHDADKVNNSDGFGGKPK